MPRAYHSPSSIALGRRCKRAWAYAYIDGLRDPEVEWSAIAEAEARGIRAKRDAPAMIAPGVTVTTRQRSTALGKATHAVLEAWYHHERPDWESLPGRVAESGRHLLPDPSMCVARIETPIGDVPIEVHGEPSLALRVHGVLWVGFRDRVTVSCAASERVRLGRPDAFPWIDDYKSTASVTRYALDEVQLADDLQANLYGYATAVEYDVTRVPSRWVYFETKQTRRAAARDVVIESARAYDLLGVASEEARELDLIERSIDAPQNTAACGDYGGCQYHESAGGPCNARRSTGGLVQARVRKGKAMGSLSQESKDKFSKFGGGRGTNGTPEVSGVPEGGAGGATETTATPEGAAGAGETPAPEALKRGRKPKAPAEGRAGAVLALAAELADASAALAAARAKHDDVLARIHEASAA